MAWLVDTDVVSELIKRPPDQRIVDWVRANETEIYTSSHVVGELQAGVAALPEGARKRSLESWLVGWLEAMEGRILNFNTSVATVWGRQEADYRRAGCPMPMPDSFIAATARRHDLTIATRNVDDFRRPGVKVFNPVAPT
jgi:toxin FitB